MWCVCWGGGGGGGSGGGRGLCIHDNGAEGSVDYRRITLLSRDLVFHLSVGVRDVLQVEYDNEYDNVQFK